MSIHRKAKRQHASAIMGNLVHAEPSKPGMKAYPLSDKVPVALVRPPVYEWLDVL